MGESSDVGEDGTDHEEDDEEMDGGDEETDGGDDDKDGETSHATSPNFLLLIPLFSLPSLSSLVK